MYGTREGNYTIYRLLLSVQCMGLLWMADLKIVTDTASNNSMVCVIPLALEFTHKLTKKSTIYYSLCQNKFKNTIRKTDDCFLRN